MKRLCLMASLLLISACKSSDGHQLFVRFANGTQFSQKVVLDGEIERTGSDPNFKHTLRFSQTVTAPALGEQRVSVQDPFDKAEVLIIYEGDVLTLKVLTPDQQTVDTLEKEPLPNRDVECVITREGTTPNGSEGSVECNTQSEPTDAGTTGG